VSCTRPNRSGGRRCRWINGAPPRWGRCSRNNPYKHRCPFRNRAVKRNRHQTVENSLRDYSGSGYRRPILGSDCSTLTLHDPKRLAQIQDGSAALPFHPHRPRQFSSCCLQELLFLQFHHHFIHSPMAMLSQFAAWEDRPYYGPPFIQCHRGRHRTTDWPRPHSSMLIDEGKIRLGPSLNPFLWFQNLYSTLH